MRIIKHLTDAAQGKHPLKTARSPRWPAVREGFLSQHPRCAVCGGIEKLEVHHIHPFHLHPELELDTTNLITLCESWKNGINCHLAIGHLGNFRSFNPDVAADAAALAQKIANRPNGEAE